MAGVDSWPRVHPLVRRRQRRLVQAAACILTTGIALGMLTYALDERRAAPTLEELMPGSGRAMRRQRALLYGEKIADALAWLDYFERPEGKRALIIGIAAFGAGICGYLAFRADDSR
jgi:hypothetical protein